MMFGLPFFPREGSPWVWPSTVPLNAGNAAVAAERLMNSRREYGNREEEAVCESSIELFPPHWIASLAVLRDQYLPSHPRFEFDFALGLLSRRLLRRARQHVAHRYVQLPGRHILHHCRIPDPYG